MKVNARQYAESLAAAQTAGKRNAEELVSGLMGVLAKKRQLPVAKKILNILVETEAEKKGEIEVVIETAHEIEKATEKIILKEAEKIYPGKKVKATFSINSTLGSGFRISGRDYQLDHSLTTHIAKLRNQLTSL